MVDAQATAAPRSKRSKKRARPTAEDFVNVVPVQVRDDLSAPVQISKARRAKCVKVSADGLTASSEGGYRSVQSSRGANSGTWFFEIAVEHLGDTGHCRLGLGTVKAEIEAPCGYTAHSFGFRDVDGSKVTKAIREPYGDPYKEGDVIGVYLHLPEGGRTMEPKSEIVRWKGRLYQTMQEDGVPAETLKGSLIGFTVNGKWQGAAFNNILEGTYYAAASLFTKSKPAAPCSATFNFGPEFKYPPQLPSELAPYRPFCEANPVETPLPQQPVPQEPLASAAGNESSKVAEVAHTSSKIQ